MGEVLGPYIIPLVGLFIVHLKVWIRISGVRVSQREQTSGETAGGSTGVAVGSVAPRSTQAPILNPQNWVGRFVYLAFGYSISSMISYYSHQLLGGPCPQLRIFHWSNILLAWYRLWWRVQQSGWPQLNPNICRIMNGTTTVLLRMWMLLLLVPSITRTAIALSSRKLNSGRLIKR